MFALHGSNTVQWFPTQAAAIEYNKTEFNGSGILIKNNNFSFGAVLRDVFIDHWQPTSNQPIYEVLTSGPVKLFLDIEMWLPEQPTEKDNQIWLVRLIDLICRHIERTSGVPAADYAFLCHHLVCNDSRPSKNGDTPGYKRSFHVTFPNVVFLDIGLMKSFVHALKTPLATLPEYHWPLTQKDGKEVSRHSIDWMVYTDRRPWRVPLARKHGKSQLLPWDVRSWQPLSLARDALRVYMDQSLCAGAGIIGVFLFDDKNTPNQPYTTRCIYGNLRGDDYVTKPTGDLSLVGKKQRTLDDMLLDLSRIYCLVPRRLQSRYDSIQWLPGR